MADEKEKDFDLHAYSLAFREEVERDLEYLKREAFLGFAIIQQNRHRSIEPYDWFGPDPEKCESGIDCECQGCVARYADSTRAYDRQDRKSCAEEFESLRRIGPKYSKSQARRIVHLERHLDLGDSVCRCY